MSILSFLALCTSCTGYRELYPNWSDNEVALPPYSDSKISVVRGIVSAEEIWGKIHCPADRICMNVIYELEVEDPQTLHGPPVAGVPIYSVQHGARSDRYRTWLVQRREDGRLWVWQQGESVGTATCFDVHPDSVLRERLEQMGQGFVADVTCFPDRTING